ncbi:hypothetical protein [Streptomyces sp. NPDC096153]|uniref:hypothetical protein n=1 Tax=Streptomyces sp. NPDC096153 TaxID=3155548 RepID=UPI003333F7C0
MGGLASAHELVEVARLQWQGGPDGRWPVHGEGRVRGTNRAAVVDPDGGRRPCRLEDGDGAVPVAFNGEIVLQPRRQGARDQGASALRGLMRDVASRVSGRKDRRVDRVLSRTP